MRSRAFRRAKEEHSKLKAVKILKTRLNREPTAEEIGRTASVHGRDCSCWMCGNPRKHFKQKSLKEQALEPIEVILRDNT
jgi:DNA-directed RNA polymerase specialized sigma subunit